MCLNIECDEKRGIPSWWEHAKWLKCWVGVDLCGLSSAENDCWRCVASWTRYVVCKVLPGNVKSDTTWGGDAVCDILSCVTWYQVSWCYLGLNVDCESMSRVDISTLKLELAFRRYEVVCDHAYERRSCATLRRLGRAWPEKYKWLTLVIAALSLYAE